MIFGHVKFIVLLLIAVIVLFFAKFLRSGSIASINREQLRASPCFTPFPKLYPLPILPFMMMSFLRSLIGVEILVWSCADQFFVILKVYIDGLQSQRPFERLGLSQWHLYHLHYQLILLLRQVAWGCLRYYDFWFMLFGCLWFHFQWLLVFCCCTASWLVCDHS